MDCCHGLKFTPEQDAAGSSRPRSWPADRPGGCARSRQRPPLRPRPLARIERRRAAVAHPARAVRRRRARPDRALPGAGRGGTDRRAGTGRRTRGGEVGDRELRLPAQQDRHLRPAERPPWSPPRSAKSASSCPRGRSRPRHRPPTATCSRAEEPGPGGDDRRAVPGDRDAPAGVGSSSSPRRTRASPSPHSSPGPKSPHSSTSTSRPARLLGSTDGTAAHRLGQLLTIVPPPSSSA